MNLSTRKKFDIIMIVASVLLGVFLFALINEDFEHSMQIKPVKYQERNRSVTYDYRDYPVESVFINLTWRGEPANATYQLKNENFTTIIEKTGKQPVFNMSEIGIKEGEYYIRIGYKARFIQGGVEYMKAWWLFSFKDNEDTLTAGYELKPQTYNDFPSELIK